MSRRKTERKEEFDILPNCLNENREWKGRWASFFGNEAPISLELGCGKARLSMGQARLLPQRNFIGIDVKAPRMWVAARQAHAEGMKNIAFLRAHIQMIEEYFAEGEVDEIWITFPDPFPRKRQIKLRMTGHAFLLRYQKIMKPGGHIYFKTDNEDLFNWTLEHFEELRQAGKLDVKIHALTRDLHNSDQLNERNSIVTDFEARFLEEGKKTLFVEFGF